MKKVTKLLITSLIITATVGAGAVAHDVYDEYVEHSMYQDAHFTANVDKAVALLEQQGYTIKKVEAEAHQPMHLTTPQPALQIEAYKGHLEYEMTLSYPDLRVLKTKIDD